VRKRVFLTGEAGMTARRLEVDLANKGFEIVWGFNNRVEELCSFNSVWDPKVKELDITKQFFKDIVARAKPDIIVHSAGFVSTEICKVRPQEAIHSNVYGTQCVIEAANQVNAKVVFFSTTAIFDPADYGRNKLIDNNTRKFPGTLYGITKCAGEHLVKRFINKDKLLILRPCFMWGDKYDMHSNLMKAILSIKYKKHYDILVDPEIEKDYTYIDDAVGLINGLIVNNAIGEFNFTRGEPRKTKEYIKVIAEALGEEPDFTYFPETDYLHYHVTDPMPAIIASKYTPRSEFDKNLVQKIYKEV
jgi:nucleoside-diphosphate-sugar epimerase